MCDNSDDDLDHRSLDLGSDGSQDQEVINNELQKTPSKQISKRARVGGTPKKTISVPQRTPADVLYTQLKRRYDNKLGEWTHGLKPVKQKTRNGASVGLKCLTCDKILSASNPARSYKEHPCCSKSASNEMTPETGIKQFFTNERQADAYRRAMCMFFYLVSLLHEGP